MRKSLRGHCTECKNSRGYTLSLFLSLTFRSHTRTRQTYTDARGVLEQSLNARWYKRLEALWEQQHPLATFWGGRPHESLFCSYRLVYYPSRWCCVLLSSRLRAACGNNRISGSSLKRIAESSSRRDLHPTIIATITPRPGKLLRTLLYYMDVHILVSLIRYRQSVIFHDSL